MFCARALAGWRERFGRTAQMRAWLDALAEFEALASLASFADEHPGFAYPTVDAGAPHFEAEALGHPLIVASVAASRTTSTSAPPGHALLITGSNMSGKEHAPAIDRRQRGPRPRRSAGVRQAPLHGLVLGAHQHADQGLARRGRVPFLRRAGRLKSVVDAVNAGDKVLFLLDEVLHGTNSRERRLAPRRSSSTCSHAGPSAPSRRTISGSPISRRESGGKVVNVHFEESVEDGKMTFDYHLKPGVVTTANALRLMKVIGIDVELPVELPPGPSKLGGGVVERSSCRVKSSTLSAA